METGKMTARMTMDRFEALVAAYGGDPLRWPEAERVAAQMLAARDGAAARLLAEAEALDRLLDEAPAAAVNAALAARILAARPQPAIGDRLRALWSDLFGGAPAWAPALGLVAAVALGTGVQAAAADRLGLDEAIETADGAESEDDIAPLTGSAAIAEEDVL